MSVKAKDAQDQAEAIKKYSRSGEVASTTLGDLLKEKMANKELKTYTLAEMKDIYIGKQGTKDRDEYEYELRMDIIGKMIKQVIIDTLHKSTSLFK